MNFQMPEGLSALSVEELNALLTDARTEAAEIAKIEDADLSDEQVETLSTLADAIKTISSEVETKEIAAAERAARIADLKAQVAEPEVQEEPADEAGEPEVEEPAAEQEPAAEDEAPEAPEATKTEDEDEEFSAEKTEVEIDLPEDVVVPNDISDIVTEQEKESTVSARQSVSQVAANAAAVEDVIAEEPKLATVVASADVPGFASGQELGGMEDIAAAFLSRARGFGKGQTSAKGIDAGAYSLSSNAKRASVAQIQKPESAFTTGMDESTEKQMQTIFEAAKESRLSGGSLVAAGGWCAPSEIWYDSFLELESPTAGLIDLPEVVARRGGIQFTPGPQLSDLLAGGSGFGFTQTETQAEAGTEKDCYAIECPDFEEFRLDAVGFCVTAGVLTNKAYPELVRRVLQLARIAHQRRMNAKKIAEIQTAAGAAIDYTEIGAATSDVLDAMTIQALRLRYTYSMDEKATIEAILPVWAKELFRADLSRRTGVDLLAVTDAQIANYFGVRGIRVQYVYDFQDFDAEASSTWTALPAELTAIMYPAGAFVALTSDVIDLDAIYDSVGLSTNTYTGAFFEEGLKVVNTGGAAHAVTVDLNAFGNTGAANVAAAAETGE